MLVSFLDSQVSHLQNGHRNPTHSLEKVNEINGMLAPSGILILLRDSKNISFPSFFPIKSNLPKNFCTQMCLNMLSPLRTGCKSDPVVIYYDKAQGVSWGV